MNRTMYSPATVVGAERVRIKKKTPDPTPYLSESAQRVAAQIEAEPGGEGLRSSLHFTAGIVERLERQFLLGCTIVADSSLVQSGLDHEAIALLPLQSECFTNDPAIVSMAAQKRITRAEVAVDQTLALKGPKLIVVGSAPMALNRLLQLHRYGSLSEVAVIGAAAGFASAIEMKERLWESGLPCIVARGRRGGVGAAIAITNALLHDIVRRNL